MLRQWEEELIEIDAAVRSRLYILTVAAEKGWKVTGDLAFGMKGILEKTPNPVIYAIKP